MQGKAFIIVNPKSGPRARRGLAGAVRDVFGDNCEVAYTKYPGHGTVLAREAVAAGCGRVVAIGGDGTVNEAANGLLDTGVPLAIVPHGSGNGLARHLGIPMKSEAALFLAKGGQEVEVDCGSVCGRNFFCTMGVGFDAVVSQEFERSQRRGLMEYSRIAVSRFLNYTPTTYRIEVDGEEYEFKAFIIAVCNASQYGNNAYIAPHASMSDGLLDITVVERGNLGSLAQAGVRLFTHSLDRSHIVSCLRGTRIRITRPASGPGHIDGEAVTLPAVLDIECHRSALRVVVP